MPFDFSKAYLVHENQRGMGFMPENLEVDSLALLHGDVTPREPVLCRQHLGSAIADLMLGADPMLLIVSDTVVRALESIGATGWTTYKVECRTEGGEFIPGRVGLSVTGRSGPPLWRLSQRFQRRLAPEAPPAPFLRGFYFDDDTWDGSDVFSPSTTGFVIVVERVHRALRAAKVRNFGFDRLTKFEMLDHERMEGDGESPTWVN